MLELKLEGMFESVTLTRDGLLNVHVWDRNGDSKYDASIQLDEQQLACLGAVASVLARAKADR